MATTGPGHATELARNAARDGLELVIAAGGDGTVHEVVNGLLGDGPRSNLPVLGVIPIGSGCDYARMFGIPSDVHAAVRRLAAERPPRTVDIGEVSYDGGRRYFANIAEVGIGAEVASRARRLPRFLGAAMYFVAFWLTLPGFRPRATYITGAGAALDGAVTNLVVSIGRAFGGGMKITPNADPSDGLFDVQVHLGSKLDFARAIPKVYRGTHIPHPRIAELRTPGLEVCCDPPALVEADGEILGHTPATFRVVPGALRLKV